MLQCSDDSSPTSKPKDEAQPDRWMVCFEAQTPDRGTREMCIFFDTEREATEYAGICKLLTDIVLVTIKGPVDVRRVKG